MENDIRLTCVICQHIEFYEYEEDLFQDGKMWVLEDDSIVCDECLTKL
jgi:hypothetical protein